MVALLLLACSPLTASDARPLPKGHPADTAAATGDTDTDSDTDTDTDTDTDADSDTDTDTDTASGPIQVCFLGPARDHGVCVDTVPYDPSTFGADYDYPAPYASSPQYATPDRYVDLDAVDPTLKVAPNFALSEYMSPTKGRWGILQGHMTDELQALRDAIGEPLTITSGYRNPAYNAGVGGVQYSRHQYGDAADLDATSLTVEQLGAACTAQGASYVGLYEDGHTHCDWRDVALDGAYWPATRSRPGADVPAPTAYVTFEEGIATAPAEGFDEGEPLRRWTATDADGNVVGTYTGRRFSPPEGAVAVEVIVGGQVDVRARLP